jgi:hypothetical protein
MQCVKCVEIKSLLLGMPLHIARHCARQVHGCTCQPCHATLRTNVVSRSAVQARHRVASRLARPYTLSSSGQSVRRCAASLSLWSPASTIAFFKKCRLLPYPYTPLRDLKYSTHICSDVGPVPIALHPCTLSRTLRSTRTVSPAAAQLEPEMQSTRSPSPPVCQGAGQVSVFAHGCLCYPWPRDIGLLEGLAMAAKSRCRSDHCPIKVPMLGDDLAA